jgi:glucose-6-phosphate isomerase, archaeal
MHIDWMRGEMRGAAIRASQKQLRDMRARFANSQAAALMPGDTLLYRVQWFEPQEATEEGRLNWGVTTLEAGRVGDEYFMTQGHFHVDESRAEFYTVASGEGMLVLMDRERRTWAEQMRPGTLHAIDGRHAHRVVNTGADPLIFWACWPGDAGHDYQSIVEHGFGARVLLREGTAQLVPEPQQ